MNIPVESLQRYGFADLASKRKQETRREELRKARQAIVVIGVDFYLRVFLLYAWAGRLATSLFTKKLIDVYDKWQPRVFGIEANAMQSLYADTVRDTAKEKLKRANFLPVNQPTNVDKDWRIVTSIEPVLATGRLFVLEEQYEFISELTGHPTARTKDIVDALASALKLIPRKPSQARRSQEAEALASYLRNSGCPAWQIQEQVDRLKSGSLA